MSSLSKPVKVVAGSILIGWLAVVVLVVRGYVWPLLTSVETPVMQAMIDPGLFTRDFAVQEWLRFNPRSYYYFALVGLTKTGLSLMLASVLAHTGALVGLLTGLFALGRQLGLASAAGAATLVWYLHVTAGAIAGVFLYTHAPLPAVWAMGGVLWGVTLALRGRWVAAYACFGAASVPQFLIGFYAGLLVLPAMPWRSWRVVATAAGLWLSCLLVNYAPLVALGSMGTPLLDNATFVEIYAKLRCPNHLVPSTWGWAAWTQFGLFYLGALLCVRELAGTRPAVERRIFASALGCAGAGLAANYLFVEVWRWSVVAKLQPPRMTEMAELATLLALALVMQARIARRDFGAAVLLALAPLTPFPGVFLTAFALLLPPASGGRALWRWAAFGTVLVLVYGLLADFNLRFTLAQAGRLAIFGAAFLVERFRAAPDVRRLAWATGVAACACAGWFALSAGARRQLAPRWLPDAGPMDAPGVLGARFRAVSPKDALVLVPPEGDSLAFRLFSQRAAVIQTKDMPFTDRGMIEYRNRVQEVIGVPFTPETDVEKAWRELPPARLTALAKRYGADHILTSDAWHPELPGATRIDRVGQWSLWKCAAP